jgi:hypothetical protein
VRDPSAMPQPMSFRGIGIRAIVAAALFFVYVLVVGNADSGQALTLAAFAFLLMLPLGFVMDRAVVRLRMRRWMRTHGPDAPRKPR